MKTIVLSLSALLLSYSLRAQLINDLASQKLAGQALDEIYSFNFTKAQSSILQLEKKYPKHPVIPFLKAYKLSWEKMPLQKGIPEYTHYTQYLLLSANYADRLLKERKEDLEGTFFNMMVYGLLAMHESEGGDFMTSLSYGKKSFSFMKKGFDLSDKYPDFHFSTGLYQYYAKQYPETHPIAKPFMSFFPGGDKTKGLWNMNQAVQKGEFSKIESLIYLNTIYAKYEQNHLLALHCAQQLVSKYPQNPFFQMKYTEGLIFVGRYAEAEINLSKFASRTENLFSTSRDLFQGLIQEFYYKSDTKAKGFYTKVVQRKGYDPRYGRDYHAFAYGGLARIAHRNQDDKSAKTYYKEALKIAEYEGLKTEAENFLKGS